LGQDSKSTALSQTGHSTVAVDEDDSWTHPDSATDLSGPVLLVLPTSPPTALASDANGNVFASPLENMVDGDPSTAEPHDVRQVWVLSRVGGEETVGFKGAHGRYLGCDEVGVISARREARGREEGFGIMEIEASAEDAGIGLFKIKTAASTAGKEGTVARFIYAAGGGKLKLEDADGDAPQKRSATKIEIRGDSEEASPQTLVRIRMQARFKPRLKANKELKAKEKVSRRELEAAVGRRLDDGEVKRLKRARRDGTYHEEVLDVRVKGKHDKFAS
jgi:protein FRG1